jgi:hypothetical protein
VGEGGGGEGGADVTREQSRSLESCEGVGAGALACLLAHTCTYTAAQTQDARKLPYGTCSSPLLPIHAMPVFGLNAPNPRTNPKLWGSGGGRRWDVGALRKLAASYKESERERERASDAHTLNGADRGGRSSESRSWSRVMGAGAREWGSRERARDSVRDSVRDANCLPPEIADRNCDVRGDGSEVEIGGGGGAVGSIRERVGGGGARAPVAVIAGVVVRPFKVWSNVSRLYACVCGGGGGLA